MQARASVSKSNRPSEGSSQQSPRLVGSRGGRASNDRSSGKKMGDPAGTVRLPGLGVVVELKYLSLALLVLQNVGLVMSIKYSRLHPTDDGVAYVTSTAVVMAEVVKLVASLVLEYAFETPRGESFLGKMKEDVFCFDTLKLSVPGILYVIQNNLLFVALSNLTVGVYQVTAQLKILTTALFSVFMLGKHLSRLQIVALVSLTAGVGVVQVSISESKGNSKASDEMNPTLGLMAVVLASLTSGFAGVYFERVLKRGKKVSLYIRNIQLAIFGVSIGLVTVYATEYDTVMEGGFFQGYSLAVWTPIMTQAVGGLLVALVMKYADNILKGFATSLSIVVASTLSTVFFGVALSALFCGGASLVLLAVYLYGKYPAAPTQPAAGAQGQYTPVNATDKDIEIPPASASPSAEVAKQ